MKKLHEMFPLIFKKPKPVSKELLSFEDWYKQKLTKKFTEIKAGKIIGIETMGGEVIDIQIEYDEYVKDFTQNNRDQKLTQLGL